MATFIVDCPHCKVKVAAERSGIAEDSGFDRDGGEPYGRRLFIGKCPRCEALLAATSYQTGFEGYDSNEDVWTEPERVYPEPARTFTSYRIPDTVKQSLSEGEKCIQSGASMAACVMFGRALEALCRDILIDPKAPEPKRLMLGKGIEELRAKNVIDQRLYDWSQQLQAFRNIAAHPEGTPISREDAEDLQAFVHAIVEYIYDLADRYDEFKARMESRAKKKRK
ncbi:DUF4145 domain-containing protein [Bradyrhizobium sp. DN5]|uniref:DUF4145 domain-containing protein n=1 Tax=Bradyrhizobium sp. DN5 TaxID=3056950 RepID=UPI003524C7C3